jgi:hypothetical protein
MVPKHGDRRDRFMHRQRAIGISTSLILPGLQAANPEQRPRLICLTTDVWGLDDKALNLRN